MTLTTRRDKTRQDKTRQDYAPPSSSSSEPASSFLLLSCHGPQVIVAPFFILVMWFLSSFCICSGAGVMRRYPTEFANRVGGMRSLEGLVIRVLSVASMQRRFHTCVVQRVENSLEFTHSLFRSLGVFSAPPSDMEVLS